MSERREMPTRRLGCLLLGCDWVFAAEEEKLVWSCRRCGREGGTRDYASAHEARRYAAALNRGRSRPSTGLLTALSGTFLAKRPNDRR